jgi:2-haloacid dehalogenase
MISFAKKKILTFDCYGTLIDWETGIVSALKMVFGSVDKSDDDWLESFAAIETHVQAANPTALYPEVLKITVQQMAKEMKVVIGYEAVVSFGDSVGHWPPFEDTAEALKQLQSRYILVILSNIDNASIRRSEQLMGIQFDHIWTAQDIGSYKPDIRNFEYAQRQIQSLGMDKPEWLHVAQSIYHDHVPAAQMGLDRVWIDRRYNKQGLGATPQADVNAIPEERYTSLTAFAAACNSDKMG